MAKVTGPRTADERCFLNKKAGCLGKQGPREACTQSSFSQQGASFPEGEQDKPGAGGAAGERGTPKIPVLFTDVPHTVCQALCAVTGMKKTRFPLSFPAKSCGAFAGEGKVSLCNVMGGGKAWGGGSSLLFLLPWLLWSGSHGGWDTVRQGTAGDRLRVWAWQLPSANRSVPGP